jgi:hypothetical protein
VVRATKWGWASTTLFSGRLAQAPAFTYREPVLINLAAKPSSDGNLGFVSLSGATEVAGSSFL